MAYEPVLDGQGVQNVAGEHVYKLRVTFGASGAVASYRSKDATIAIVAATDGTYTVTLPKVYNEITHFSFGWFAASGVAPLIPIISTNSVDTAGTFVIKLLDSNTAGTATDPVSGNVLYLTVGVSCDLINNNYTG
jgi:hypothetical protein